MGSGLPISESPEEMAARAHRDTQLVRLAARLGVEEGGEGVVDLITSDGQAYSWIALVHAHLDRIEAA